MFTNIAPFTTTSFSSHSIELGGGIVPSGTTSTWGGPNGGSLLINPGATVEGTANFDFKENPLVGPLVPLPSAAWSSASLLVGLGIWSGLRKSGHEPAD